MQPDEVKVLLRGVESGTTTVEEAVRALSALPVDDIDLAQVDVHRELRQGIAEAIYAEGKTGEEVARIATVLLEKNSGPVLATRVPAEMASYLTNAFSGAVHHTAARVVAFRSASKTTSGKVAIVSAGTSDGAVAEEAAVVVGCCGGQVERVNDVGVAGLHRLLRAQDRLHAADVVIVVAGMEGALASLVGGITASPVIAVPTSVGYGSSFEGLAALLAMLNSCAAGVAVMNIDNGFGAAMFALRLLRALER
jgi:NCAIR mutase (PurE)-related protein